MLVEADVEIRKVNGVARVATVTTINRDPRTGAETITEHVRKFSKRTLNCECGNEVVIGNQYPDFAFVGTTVIPYGTLCDCGRHVYAPEKLPMF